MPSKLIELEIARPGIFGVNTASSGDIMPKEFSVQSVNLVFSDENFPVARNGSKRQHASTLQTILSTVGSQTVRTIYDTTDELGNDMTIFATEDKIGKISGSTVTDITGTITAPSAGNWKFQNLNDEIYGFQPGHGIIILATPSTGTFANATLTGTAAPATNGSGATDILTAAGRLWVLDGDQLHYSNILNPLVYSAGNGGAFDLNASMLKGEDQRVALAEFNGNLLIFYRRHITVWTGIWNPNGTGTVADLGTPDVMQVIENISGVGCIARDSIQESQNDLVFLSEQGVTSLSRVVDEKSMPLTRYSDNVRKDINKLVQSVDLSTVWSVYLEGKGVYILGAPTLSKCFVIDVANALPDGSRRVTTWNKAITTMGVSPISTLVASDDAWKALWISDEAQYISKVEGWKDYVASNGDGGSTYDVVYESGWTPIDDDFEDFIKIPKKLYITMKGAGDQAFNINLAFDYGSFTDSRAKVGSIRLASESKYGTATYGGVTISETTAYYGSGTAISLAKAAGFGSGRIIKVKLTATVGTAGLAINRIAIKSKIGRQQ